MKGKKKKKRKKEGREEEEKRLEDKTEMLGSAVRHGALLIPSGGPRAAKVWPHCSSPALSVALILGRWEKGRKRREEGIKRQLATVSFSARSVARFRRFTV